MFATFNKDIFPIVKVIMRRSPENADDFNNFLNEWTQLYNNKKDFSFIFYIEDVGIPHIKYLIQMTQYIRDLRKKEYQYLQKSIIFLQMMSSLKNTS